MLVEFLKVVLAVGQKIRAPESTPEDGQNQDVELKNT
jgi:hypothetical protein